MSEGEDGAASGAKTRRLTDNRRSRRGARASLCRATRGEPPVVAEIIGWGGRRRPRAGHSCGWGAGVGKQRGSRGTRTCRRSFLGGLMCFALRAAATGGGAAYAESKPEKPESVRGGDEGWRSRQCPRDGFRTFVAAVFEWVAEGKYFVRKRKQPGGTAATNNDELSRYTGTSCSHSQETSVRHGTRARRLEPLTRRRRPVPLEPSRRWLMGGGRVKYSTFYIVLHSRRGHGRSP